LWVLGIGKVISLLLHLKKSCEDQIKSVWVSGNISLPSYLQIEDDFLQAEVKKARDNVTRQLLLRPRLRGDKSGSQLKEWLIPFPIS